MKKCGEKLVLAGNASLRSGQCRVMIRSVNALLVVIVGLLAMSSSFGEVAQPQLPTVTLTINASTVRAELATDDSSRATGLMFREDLAPGEGMLFVMPSVGPAAFYMKNTRIPLSIAYIGPKGTILEIHDLEPLNERPVQSRFQNIAYALEVKQGWFAKQGIFPGVRVQGLPPGPN